MVKVLGKRVTFVFMEQHLQRDWEGKGKIHVIDMNRDYFLMRRTTLMRLWKGPGWLLGTILLFRNRDRPTEARKIAAWIRIPNFPIELYNHRFLWKVGSTIGHMLKIDRTTSIHSRGKFARICVEIDLAKQLVPRISVFGCELHLEYEGLYQIYFSCGRYGHRSEQCSENLSTNGNPMDGVGAGSNPPVDSTAEHGDDQNRKFGDPRNQHNNEIHGNGQNNPDFGPWMMVKRYSNKKKIQIGQKESHGNQRQITKNNDEKDESPRRKDSDGFRFTVLHEENSEDAQGSLERGENVQKEIEVDVLQQTQAQNRMDKTPVQKRILRHGAGNPPPPKIKKKPYLPQRITRFGWKTKPQQEQGKKPDIYLP
ncbi:hypothetical protein Ahy_B05g074234 [Arachis hypogaea]|uniref:Uncharacterized protein n=1 Tax=Arachis hypogaea TaxID=3818 RepID=A0A444YY97_ARAHY|nr:hypothetical protein Ahy_B05g074234 [Arachis hypogaea]